MSSNVVEKRPKFVYNSITIEMDYPLSKNDPYEIRTTRTDNTSLSGVKQSAFERNEEYKDIVIEFAQPARRDALITMYKDWASEGKVIRFYPDKDQASYDEVTILEKTFSLERQAGGTDVWKVKFTIRKEIT